MSNQSVRLEAELLWKAGFNKKFKNIESIQLLVLYAQRTNLNPLSLVTSCKIEQSKIVMEVETIFSLIKSSVASKEIEGPYFNDDGEFSSTIIKRKGIPYKSTFSMEDAHRLNLLDRPSWLQNPSRMLRNRALIDTLRQAFPEFTVGVVTEDELEDNWLKKSKNFLKQLSNTKNSLVEKLKNITFVIKVKQQTSQQVPRSLSEGKTKVLGSCNDDCFAAWSDDDTIN